MALKKVDIRNILEDEDLSVSERVSSILDLLHNETDAIKDERDDIKAQLEEAQKKTPDNSQSDEWKTKYETEKAAFDEYKDNQTKKETRVAKENAYRQLLVDAGVDNKRINSIMKVADIEGIEFEDGKVKDSASIEASIKAEWSDFIEQKQTKGSKTENPVGTTGGDTVTKEQFSKMGYKDRLKLFNEHPETYNKLKGE